MEKKLTKQEIEEQELADKFKALYKERFALDLKRGNGVTLDKGEYIGERTTEINEEISKLKSDQKSTP